MSMIEQTLAGALELNFDSQIKFGNGKTVKYETQLEEEQFYNGENRRVLSVICETNAIGLEELAALLSAEENTKNIVAKNLSLDVENLISDFVIKLDVGIRSFRVQEQTPNQPAVYKDFIIFVLGRRTYFEQYLENLKK